MDNVFMDKNRHLANSGRFLILLAALGYGPAVIAGAIPTHMDRSLLPKSCISCHGGGHGAKKTALLKTDAYHACLSCHDNRSRERDVRITPRTEMRDVQGKASHHPVEETGSLHWKGEGIGANDLRAERHVACGDCHDPHWSTPEKPYARVDGINSFGIRVPQAQAEYEVCFKCHGDNANLPKTERNKRLEFYPSNPSYHPVEAQGKSSNVPSLMSPWSVTSTITCSDCHNNDNGLGPRGPHGSIYSPILVLNYGTQDGFQESNFQYALCYKCHNRQSILGDKSFPFHSLHIVRAKASCFTCHNSHGSQTNTHLIRFNPKVVGLPVQQQSPAIRRPLAAPLANGGAQLSFSALPLIDQTSFTAGSTELGRYVDFGNGHGECFLSCHGIVHNPASY
ncbi:MAG TPA: cytochrome c3 family protein [Geobacteraceae bacterium]